MLRPEPLVETDTIQPAFRAGPHFERSEYGMDELLLISQLSVDGKHLNTPEVGSGSASMQTTGPFSPARQVETAPPSVRFDFSEDSASTEMVRSPTDVQLSPTSRRLLVIRCAKPASCPHTSRVAMTLIMLAFALRRAAVLLALAHDF
eukprot:6172737-Pleurochrysis_carterae.AAC.4